MGSIRTLLVLAEHPDLAASVRAAVDPDRYRVVHRANLEEAEPLLVHGLADVSIVDTGLDSVQGIWLIERLRRRDPKRPIIVCTAHLQREWEEDAYLKGASYIITKPPSPRTLCLLLDRLWSDRPAPVGTPPVSVPPPSQPVAEPFRSTETTHFFPAPTLPSLTALRDLSAILTHSLDSEAMLKQCLLLLRELLGINRGVMFLRQAPASVAGLSQTGEPRRLRAACSVAVSSGLLEHFNLSLDTGIGGHLMRLGRVLRRGDDEVRNDAEAQKEFELLCGQVAVPIYDREDLVGVAVFDRHVTGEALSNTELEFIFHLLEQLGLAVRNIWLHEQLAANHQMMTEVLRELSSACLVVSRDLQVLHANKAARKLFQHERHAELLNFTDLPHVLGTKVYQVLNTGSAVANFRYEPEQPAGTVFRVSVVPFRPEKGGVPGAALLTMEDLTQAEQLRHLEVEASNLRLIRSMAEQLVHEIGNAMVPLSTHQQLFRDKWRDQEFRETMDNALSENIKRVNRLLQQMRYLAANRPLQKESVPLTQLIEEAYQDACKYQAAKATQLRYEAPSKPLMVSGDRAALKHALFEMMLNALQANPAEPKVGVSLAQEYDGRPTGELLIEVRDNGTGFSAHSAEHATDPFFTTRNVGLGLGLTVTRKIIETHNGRLEIIPPQPGTAAGIVRVSLPVEETLVA